jgi:ion channel-forming bestrophin family protein
MTTAKASWFRVALQLKGSVIPVILPRILLCSGFGFLISLIQYYGYSIPEQIFGSVISNVAYNLVLGLLVVFRTNTAYDRYWEGRKTWGGIVVNILNLGRKIKLAVLETELIDKENKIAALRLLGAFAIATKLHLRQQPVNSELQPLLSESQYLQLQEVKNAPLKIAFWIGEYLKQQQLQNRLSMDEFLPMNTLLDSMVEALMGCERILKTPMPLAYAIYLKRLLLIYCLVLPLQLVHDLSWWTALIVGLISFILFGIEEIGDQIEDPFGKDANDLPISEICTTLIQNLEDLNSQPEVLRVKDKV